MVSGCLVATDFSLTGHAEVLKTGTREGYAMPLYALLSLRLSFGVYYYIQRPAHRSESHWSPNGDWRLSAVETDAVVHATKRTPFVLESTARLQRPHCPHNPHISLYAMPWNIFVICLATKVY